MKTPLYHTRKISRAAFTLIELLVVIVIIAILSAIAIPIFNAVKSKASATKSSANLRTIGQALSAYESENDGKMPALAAQSKIPQLTNWVAELVIVLNTDATIAELVTRPPVKSFISPSITWKGSSSRGLISPGDLLYTYSATDSMVGFDYDDKPDSSQGRRTSRIDKRPQSLLIVEGAQQGNTSHSYPWIDWGKASGDLSKGENGTFVEFRYRKRLNALMSDFSVKSFNQREAALILQWHWSGFGYPVGY